jgi:hypothetical protein
LGYDGRDREVGENLVAGTPFRLSNNQYDWLGPGIDFWEANRFKGIEWGDKCFVTVDINKVV